MPKYYLGIDGGQSSTTALIGDDSGRTIGRGVAGPCNHVGAEEGRRRFTSALGESVTAACEDASLPPDTEFEAAFLGLSGGPADKEDLVRQMLRARRIGMSHDARIALAGATGGEPGVIVIAGTGSIAFGRNAQGKTARAGGWGYIFGDEGGAFDIVRQALRAAIRQEEGWGTPTALHPALLEATGAPDANSLMHLFYTDDYPRDRVATFAKVVGETARSGDAVALEILHAAGQQLANLAAAVSRQLFQNEQPFLFSGVGGVFEEPYVLHRFRTLVELTAGATFTTPRHPPAKGALLEAHRL